MAVVGNEAAVSALCSEFPTVALLAGPTSVGKWSAAEQARRAHDIVEPDVLRVRRLDMPGVHQVVDFASRAASRPAGRVAIVSLDIASPSAMNVLLKPLEEAVLPMHFLLVASGHVPVTIASRARRYDFGLLSVDEISRILIETRHIQPSVAARLAKQSGGQVRKALGALVVADEKSLVLSCIRNLRERDTEALEGLADRWRDEHTELLSVWAHEAVSKRWRLFTPEETGEAGTLPLRVLLALRRDVRPRLVIRSVLMDLVPADS